MSDAFKQEHGDLLQVARRDSAPEEVRRRAEAALLAPSIAAPGLKAAISKLLGATAVGSQATKAVAGAVLIVSAAVVAGGVVSSASPADSVASYAAPSVAEPSARANLAAPERAKDEVGTLDDSPPPRPAPLTRATPSIVASTSTHVVDRESLGAETSLLAATKRALSAGDVVGAERSLASYERAFPHGTLAEDAEALRIEVDARAGREAKAARAFAEFADAHPKSPVSERLRRLLELKGDAGPQ